MVCPSLIVIHQEKSSIISSFRFPLEPNFKSFIFILNNIEPHHLHVLPLTPFISYLVTLSYNNYQFEFFLGL